MSTFEQQRAKPSSSKPFGTWSSSHRAAAAQSWQALQPGELLCCDTGTGELSASQVPAQGVPPELDSSAKYPGNIGWDTTEHYSGTLNGVLLISVIRKCFSYLKGRLSKSNFPDLIEFYPSGHPFCQIHLHSLLKFGFGPSHMTRFKNKGHNFFQN